MLRKNSLFAVLTKKKKKKGLMWWSRLQVAGKGVLPPWGCSQIRAGQPGQEGGRKWSWRIIHKRRSIWGRGNSFWVKIYPLKTNILAGTEHWKPTFSGVLQQGIRDAKNVEAKNNGSWMFQNRGFWKTSLIFKVKACGGRCFAENKHIWMTLEFQKTLC